MRKFVATTDDSIGAELLGNGKARVAREIEGRKVVEIIEETSDIIDEALPILQHIIQQLKDFFNAIFNRFPCVIVEKGNNYVFTEQRAPWKAIDRVFYMNADDGNDKIFEFEAPTIGKARNLLYKQLKQSRYVK